MECFLKNLALGLNPAQKREPLVRCHRLQLRGKLTVCYICMQVQVGLAANMNNKRVVRAAASISSALRKLGL